MRLRTRSRLLVPAVAGVLLLLLTALATLQYRWIGRVSDLERQRLQAGLEAAGSRFVEDFDRELTRTFAIFHPELGASMDEALRRVARQHERWRAEAPWPALVRDLFVMRRSAAGEVELQVLRPEVGRFEVAPWPADLDGMRRRLTVGLAAGRRELFPWGSPVAPRLPGLVMPLAYPPERVEPDVLVLRFDERVIAGEILPELARRHFGGREEAHYALAVLDASGRPVFRSDPSVPLAAFRTVDLRLGLFGLRPIEELRLVGTEPEKVAPRRSHDHGIHILHAPRWRVPRSGAAWLLAIQHRRGSLEAAVAAVRRHNLAVSLGVLVLIAATTGLLAIAAQRAERLARQQMELVAGVTHELHTPLTAIRSAGQNLADGVVADPQQVRRYGELIEREGRRLSEMVAQALELAGIQSGRRLASPGPEDVGSLLDGALDDCRGLLDERGVAVERQVPGDLPPVLADGSALRRALRNLIENAVRHGGQEPWVGLLARRGPGGEVEITVADRGPGIRREDLPRLFEPFYRGRDALAKGVPGSGLGLSVVRQVVEAQGGRVSVAAGDGGRGSAFTLHLAAAPAGEAPA